jgi:hypothetical protein
MANENTVKEAIRARYRSTYEWNAKNLMPRRNKISRGLYAGGIFSMIGGALGVVAGGILASLSLPFVLPALIGGGAVFFLVSWDIAPAICSTRGFRNSAMN